MAETFPVKPKLKPTSGKTIVTPESRYWRSFKIPKDIESKSFIYPINSISFSPSGPHDFAAAHSASISVFNGKTLETRSTISSFRDTAASPSFRCDGKLLAAGDLTGTVHVFDSKVRGHLRRLKGHAAAARLVRYPSHTDKLHLFSGGDDSVVKYWDVSTEKCVSNLLGHKDYVRAGDASPVDDNMFVSGSYDHGIKLWDVRETNMASVMELDHGKPVESVIYLPSGSLIATAGGNSVKIWDVIGGGQLLHSMESHIKTVTSLCLGKTGKTTGNEESQYRILSVSLDGYLKIFDYAKFKITHTVRFPEPLLSVGFSLDCSTRVIGSSKGNLYIGRRKIKTDGEEVTDHVVWRGVAEDETQKKILRPSYFRYFHRGQNEKPSEGDYLVKRVKKVKTSEHDKLLKKFRHNEALVASLDRKNPGSVVAVMEELVARKKLIKCVLNLDLNEFGLLLGFLQKYSTMPRYAGFLTKVATKVVELRAEDISGSDQLRNLVRNLKRNVEEEIRVQQSLLEVQVNIETDGSKEEANKFILKALVRCQTSLPEQPIRLPLIRKLLHSRQRYHLSATAAALINHSLLNLVLFTWTGITFLILILHHTTTIHIHAARIANHRAITTRLRIIIIISCGVGDGFCLEVVSLRIAARLE